jgi:hypothetical protein
LPSSAKYELLFFRFLLTSTFVAEPKTQPAELLWARTAPRISTTMTRPEMVENGLKFLRHPNVQATPLSERVSFLEQKGMTKDEIQQAIERYQTEPDTGSAPVAPVAPVVAQGVAAVAPMVAAAAAPVQQLIRRRRMPTYLRVILTISSVVGAATILGFIWNYMVHAGYFPWFVRYLPIQFSVPPEGWPRIHVISFYSGVEQFPAHAGGSQGRRRRERGDGEREAERSSAADQSPRRLQCNSDADTRAHEALRGH